MMLEKQPQSAFSRGLSRRGVLTTCLAAGLFATTRASGQEESYDRLPSLKAVGQKAGIPFGLCEPSSQLPGHLDYFNRIANECSVFAPGNDFNWAAVEKKPGLRTYQKLDVVANFMQARGVGIIGHCLLWYHAIPPWLPALDAAELRQAIEAYVTGTITRFSGKVVRWDVVNEPIFVPDGGDGLRKSLFFQKLGFGYMKDAFAYARAADPKVTLCCNEFGIEDRTPAALAKRASFLKLLRRFRAEKVEVDCVGLQSHLDITKPLDCEGMTSFLREIKHLGYKVAVTELDVLDRMLPGDDAERDRKIADYVASYLDCILAVTKPLTITCWGVTDDRTWLKMFNKRPDGRQLRPLPYDSSFRRKAEWDAIYNAIRTKG